MGKWANDLFMDAALSYVSTGTTVIVCSAQPANYSQATTTYKLAGGTIDSGYFTISDGDASGRKVTISQVENVPVDVSGTATHVAICSADTLLYVTTCTSQILTAGNTLTLPAWKIEITDPS